MMRKCFDDRAPACVPARHAFAFGALALLGVLAVSVLSGSEARASDARFQKWSLRPMCALWDGQAGEAIARRVTQNRDDIDLRQLGDAIFRMRRARHSCDIGWLQVACEDYLAIMRNVPGISSEWPGSNSVCPLAVADDDGSEGRQTARQDALE
jgi:hypothetical protein